MAISINKPLGRRGKLTGYINAVRQFKPNPTTVGAVAKTSAQQDVLGPRWGGRSYIDTGAPAGPVRIATVGGGRAGGGGGGGGATTAAKVDPIEEKILGIVDRVSGRFLTPAQEAAKTNALINAQMKMGLAGIRASSAAQVRTLQAAQNKEQARLRAQEQRAQQFAMAIGSLRNDVADQTREDYRLAGHDIQGLGTGLTGAVADAQQAAADQSAAELAQRTGGLATTKGLDVGNLRNLDQYTGVTMPARSLYEDAANKAALARWEQGVRAQQISNIAGDYRTKEDQSADAFGENVATALANRTGQEVALRTSRPSLYQTALANLQSGDRSDIATMLSALGVVLTGRQTAAQIAASTAKTANDTATAAANVTQSNAAAGASNASAGATTAKVTGVDKKGNLVKGFYFGAPGKKQPTAIPTGWRLYTEGQGGEKTHLIVPSKPFYWAAPGHTAPTAIPDGLMLDPKDPTNHTLKQVPKPPTASNSPAATAKADRAAINTSIKDLTKAAGSATFTRNETPPLMKGIRADHWVPAKGMTYAKAKAKLLEAYVPAKYRKNQRVLAAIDNALASWGYKVP